MHQLFLVCSLLCGFLFVLRLFFIASSHVSVEIKENVKCALRPLIGELALTPSPRRPSGLVCSFALDLVVTVVAVNL